MYAIENAPFVASPSHAQFFVLGQFFFSARWLEKE